MQKLLYNVKIALLALGLLFTAPHPVLAQTLVVNDDLTFGHIAILDNSAPRDIVLHPPGNYTADPAYVFYADEPALGSLTVTGQVPNTIMNVTIDFSSTVVGVSGGGGGSATFTLLNPFTVPAVVVTDGAGNATFQVGATLRSDGTGTPFLDANYLGIFSVSVAP